MSSPAADEAFLVRESNGLSGADSFVGSFESGDADNGATTKLASVRVATRTVPAGTENASTPRAQLSAAAGGGPGSASVAMEMTRGLQVWLGRKRCRDCAPLPTKPLESARETTRPRSACFVQWTRVEPRMAILSWWRDWTRDRNPNCKRRPLPGGTSDTRQSASKSYGSPCHMDKSIARNREEQASMRSSIPPWPGRSSPSLASARVMSDSSDGSPSTLATSDVKTRGSIFPATVGCWTALTPCSSRFPVLWIYPMWHGLP